MTTSTDTETRLAVKACAKGHSLTVVGARRLIIREGLRNLLAKEKQKDREVIKKVLGLYHRLQRYLECAGDYVLGPFFLKVLEVRL